MLDGTAGHTHDGTTDQGPTLVTFLTTALTSTSWDGDAYSTTAPTLIDLSAVFGVPAGVKAILATIGCNDSAAWGTADLYVALNPSNSATQRVLRVHTFGGDILNGGTGVVPCDSNGDVYYSISASGAGTMDIIIRIWGYWT